jgi:hypothetical protein
VTSILDTLTDEQRIEIKILLSEAICRGINGRYEDAVDIAEEAKRLLPDPKPVMVDMKRVQPLLDALNQIASPCRAFGVMPCKESVTALQALKSWEAGE